MMQRERAFTLIELLVAVAVAAIVLTLAVPSFNQFILRQRLKSINAQLITDLQLARSEAVTRGKISRVVFDSSSTLSCYSIFVLKPGSAPVRCDCKQGPGAACDPNTAIEIRTVQLPLALGVKVVTRAGVDPAIGFDPVNGGLMTIPTDTRSLQSAPFQVDTELDDTHLMRTWLSPAGRPQVCSLGDSYGAPAC
jgi:prepilin-type N-terminal cleavage/methylation domain-containing protein